LGQPLAKAVNFSKFAFSGHHHQLLSSYSICLRTNHAHLHCMSSDLALLYQ
jgi:hypothetical protein